MIHSGSALAQSIAAKFLRGDDSQPKDRTPFRPICFVPPESKPPFETPQNFPEAAACREILSSRTAHLPVSAKSTAPFRRIPSAASSILRAVRSFSPLCLSLLRRSLPQSQLLRSPISGKDFFRSAGPAPLRALLVVDIPARVWQEIAPLPRARFRTRTSPVPARA